MSRRRSAKIILTYSAASLFDQCPRAYELCYISFVKRAGFAGALSVGSSLHKAFEHAEPGSVEGPLHYALGVLYSDAEAAGLDKDSLDMHAAKLTAMWRSWVKHNELPDFNEREQVAVKHLCFVRGVGNVSVAGKVDGILADGSVWELKTCGTSLDDAEYTQRHSVQVPLYKWLTEATGAGTVCIVRKPSIKQKQNESVTEYRDRAIEAYDAAPGDFFRTIELDDTITTDYAIDYMTEVAQHIGYCERKKKYPRRYGTGCRSLFGWCPYKALCWHNDFEAYRQGEIAHEELGL